MTPTTYGRDFAYCLKSHGGVRGFNASLWRFLLRCTLFCHSVATFLTSVSSYEGGCGFEDYKRNKLTNPKYCIVGDSSLFITYNGDILGCFQDFSGKCIVANIRNSNLKDIIKHKKDKVGRYEFCSNCNSNIAILNID